MRKTIPLKVEPESSIATPAAILHCESPVPNDAQDLQLLLFLPKRNPLFRSVHERLEKVAILSWEAQSLLQDLFSGTPITDLQDQLRGLPHLDEAKHNSREYATLEKVLYDLSSKEPMDTRLSQYFCEVLDRFVAARSPEMRPHILFLMVSAILRNAIACGLSLNHESGPICEQVRAMLKGDETNRPSVANEVLVALRATSVFLRDPSKELRLDARHICEVFQLPLELPKMLSLSIDGVKLDDEQKVNGLVLVIGTTGSGKSTLINILTGIQYELQVDPNTGTSFLQPIEGQPVPPAKVGHDVTAQTLYPQVIPTRDRAFFFCDCPGFDDNRRGNEAICASLGVPLAIRHASKISAIILTVDYGMTDGGAGRGIQFRLLNQTLAGIIKLPEQAHNLPFFFAMTRPPKDVPTSVLHRQLIYRIQNLFSQVTRKAKSLSKQEQRLAELRASVWQLKADLKELGILKQDAVDGHVWTLGDFLASLLGGLVESSRIEKKVSEMKTEWRERGLPETSVEKLGDVLRQALELHRQKKSQFVTEIDKQIKNWKRDKANFTAQSKALRQEMENIRGEEAVLKLMLKNTDNLFIIRGFKGTGQDEPDDQESLYQALSKDSEIPKDLFVFDSENRAFDAVKNWIEEFSGNFVPKLQLMVRLQKDISCRLAPAIEDARAFIKQTKEEILSEVKGDSDDEIAKHLKVKLDNFATQAAQLDAQFAQLYQERAEHYAELRDIKTAPARDFRSELKLEKAPWDWLTRHWGWSFEFRRQNLIESTIASVLARPVEPEIPIERVELSCVLDEENRVAFKTDIDAKGVEDENLAKFGVSNQSVKLKALTEKKVSVVCSSETCARYGHFVIKKCDLEKGIFSAKYFSDGARMGRCGVRVFVLPRNMPVEKAKIQELQSQIEVNQVESASIATRSNNLARNIANDKEYLELLKAGNRNQSAKILRIVELLSRLGACQEEDVINLLGLDEAVLDSFRWLRNPAHFEQIQSILRFQGEGFPEAILGIDLRTLLAIMGVNFTLHMAVVKDKEEAKQRKSELKLGEALVYKEQQTGKIRIFYQNDEPKRVAVDHREDYNLISALITRDEPDDQVFRVVYGMLQPKVLPAGKILKLDQQKSKIKLDKLMQALPRQLFVNMQKVSQRTGFTIASFHTILTGLKQQYELERAAMQSCKKLEREKALEEFFFTQLKSFYEASALQLLTIEEIIALLNYGNHRAASNFLGCYQEVKSSDLSQIAYAVSGELEEFVEREVVEQKLHFMKKYAFSATEWINVVSGFKARAILWVGRYPDKARIEFESQKPEPQLTAIGVSAADAASKLSKLGQADEFARAALVWELRAFMERENRIPPDLAAERDQLEQNTKSLRDTAEHLVMEFGLDHKFTSLQSWSIYVNRFPDAAEGSAKATTCLQLAQSIRVHFAATTKLEERLLTASRSDDMFTDYCQSIAEGKPVGPETLALVAKLSGKPLVVWEQLLSEPRILHVKASSSIKGGKAVHLLFVPTGKDTYEFATLFHHDELVGPDMTPDDEGKREARDEESKQSPPASASSADAVVGEGSPSSSSCAPASPERAASASCTPASPERAAPKRPPPPPFSHESKQ